MKRIYYISILLLSLFIVNSVTYSAGSGFDTAYARVLQNRLEYLKTTYSLVGISAAVEVPGQGVWLGTAGISEVNVDLTPAYVFDIGSITKNFMAALVLQLAEQDSLSLNDSIGTYLPQYPNVNNKATIRQVLKHTSGIYNFTDNPAFTGAINSDMGRLWTLEEVAQGYVLNQYFAPGAGWRYSNTNYILMAMIIKKIMKTELSELLRTRFFQPLGMNDAYLEMQDSIKAPFAHNWISSGGNLIDAYGIPRTAFISSTMGAGGIITRPEDMLKWLRGLNTGLVLNQTSLSEMLTFVNANISGGNGYGLGTMRYNVNGKTCWGHAGNSFGHSTFAMYYAPDSISVSVMMNRDINTGPLALDFMNTVLSNSPIGVQQYSSEVPSKFKLQQNYPNPFNPETKIRFALPKGSYVKLSVYDVTGKTVTTLVDKTLSAGSYESDWNASNYPSGVYFYRLEAGSYTETRKMILVK